MKVEEIRLSRNGSCHSSSTKILPKIHHLRAPPDVNTNMDPRSSDSNRPLSLLRAPGHSSSSSTSSLPVLSLSRLSKTRSSLASLFRSLISIVSLPIPSLSLSLSAAVPTRACRWLSLPAPAPARTLRRKVTGTLFGHRKGHVTFSIQDHPRSDPVILIELACSTSALVKEMSSGLLRIALECYKSTTDVGLLYSEPVWTMYCNGSKCGYATSRAASDFDFHVLRTVQSVSVGAGVIPQLLHHPKAADEGELLYMRARFERVVGTRDSEAFYMLNPDGNGGPDLSIFLLRL